MYYFKNNLIIIIFHELVLVYLILGFDIQIIPQRNDSDCSEDQMKIQKCEYIFDCRLPTRLPFGYLSVPRSCSGTGVPLSSG